nr:protein yobA [Raoultella sp. NCTC 9187]
MRILAASTLRAAALLAGFLASASAFAHAHLQQQTPAADSTVNASPQALNAELFRGYRNPLQRRDA